MSTKQNNGWNKVGSIRKGEKPTKVNDKSLYIKLEDGVDIYVNGKKLDLNKSRTLQMQDPRISVKRLADNGTITAEEAQKRLERLDGNMSFLRYELVAAPPQE